MARYVAEFSTTINLRVTVDEDDEDIAADVAWELAEEYLRSLVGDHRQVSADATLDGIGAEVVREESR